MSDEAPHYACPCGRRIRHEYVEGVLPGGWQHSGHRVVVAFRCECDPEREQVRRYPAFSEAIIGITGGQGLPYRNPQAWRPVPADSREMKEWRAFIARHGHDVGAFIEALN